MNVIIEKIEIVSFGKLKNVVVKAEKGINILSAPNESGKTTLAAFIKFVFYGFAGTKKSFPQNERKLYTPWDCEVSEGSLKIDADGTKYDITRRALPSGKESVEIVNRATGKPEFKGEVPGEHFFGVTEEIFARTLFFRQLTLPENKDEVLAERLRNIALGSDEEVGTVKALKRLNDARLEIKSRVGGGIVPKLELERDRLESAITDCNDIRREVDRLHSEIASRGEKIEFAESKLNAIEQERRNIEKYEALLKLKHIKRLSDEESVAQREYLECTSSLGNQAEIDISALSAKNTELVIEQRNLLNIQKEFETARNEFENVKSPENVPEVPEKSGKALPILFFSLAVVCGAAGVFFLPLLALCAVFAVLGIIFAVSSDRKSKAASAEGEALKMALEARKKSASLTLERRANELETVQNTVKILSEELFSELNRFIPTEKSRDYSDSINKLRSTLLESERRKLVFEAKHNELLSLTENANLDEIAELARNATEPKRDRLTVERELNFYSQQLESLLEVNRKSELESATLEAKSGDVATMVGKRNSLNERISELYTKQKGYEAAIRLINESADYMKSMVAPRIGNRANIYFTAATDGKYDSFEVDTSLSMSFGDDFRRSCEYLSAGTRDSAYLSLRLALADILFGGNGVPMLLDDAFVRMDGKRLTAMLKALYAASQTHQIFIFTHGEREKLALSENKLAFNEISIRNG